MTEFENKRVTVQFDPNSHLNGYGGFCPQYQRQFGASFGKLTSELNCDPKVVSSGNRVLSKIPQLVNEAERQRQARIKLLQGRTQSLGSQRYFANMISGYAALVPKSEQYFGKSFPETTMNAIAEFEQNNQHNVNKANSLHMMQALQTGAIVPTVDSKLPKVLSNYKTPLTVVAKQAKPYILKPPPGITMSPFTMSNDDPHKLFMSNYSGCVPWMKTKVGMSFPIMTNDALKEFAGYMKVQKATANSPVQVKRLPLVKVEMHSIYPVRTGMIRHYAGHIPGEIFRHGRTFAITTKNVLGLPVAMT